MLKINYIVKLKNYNNKLLKITPLSNIFILNSLLSKNLTISPIKKINKTKTLVMSPFHYKTSKKIITISNIVYKLTFNVELKKKESVIPLVLLKKKELLFHLNANMHVVKANIYITNV